MAVIYFCVILNCLRSAVPLPPKKRESIRGGKKCLVFAKMSDVFGKMSDVFAEMSEVFAEMSDVLKETF